MGRGLGRRFIFSDDEDKCDFLARLGENLQASGSQCLAWAIMSNHYHLLIRVGSRPLSRLMSALLGGYAGYYNRRHDGLETSDDRDLAGGCLLRGHGSWEVSWGH